MLLDGFESHGVSPGLGMKYHHDLFTESGVGDTHDDGVEYAGMGFHRGFDLFGEDLLAARIDGGRAPAVHGNGAVGFDSGQVPGNRPTNAVSIYRERRRRLDLIPVIAERDASGLGQSTDLASSRSQRPEIVIEHRGLRTHHEPGPRCATLD